ncbi:hypothetical protein ANCCAN_27640 [Ancylostoma caninum]|uniref:PID domain-containing protein n=1 Tax=Ancylostoma caninum TaxID=29170 RepID=A0A368F3G1_ANCCA|nr:hypothetical protein ANCCAN_27640 [Ancylostoma caninum]
MFGVQIFILKKLFIPFFHHALHCVTFEPRIDEIAMVHEPAVLIEGVLFRARYLGSTQMMCESRGSKAARVAQAPEAVARVKVTPMSHPMESAHVLGNMRS